MGKLKVLFCWHYYMTCYDNMILTVVWREQVYAVESDKGRGVKSDVEGLRLR